jgi:hypothetical protein
MTTDTDKVLEKAGKKLIAGWAVIIILFLLGGKALAAEAENLSAGFLFDQFKLTLEDGWRTEAAGPLFYSEHKESEAALAVPPLFSNYENSIVNHSEFDLLYPLLTYEHYSDEWRWQFFQLLSFAGGRQADDFQTHRFTLFPVYFQQRSRDPKLEYTALLPFYGHLKNRLFRDEIFFVMFPVFGESRKRDVVTDNYFYPVGHVRHGDGLHGWQVWPLAGSEHKEPTTQTNGFGDIAINGGHDTAFFLWPFWLSEDNGLGTDNPEKFRASIPAFAMTRSPKRDSTSGLWPLFTWIDERDKKYREWQGPWPFVIFTRGEGKTTDRIWPLFSQSHNATTESDSYVWPIYQYKWLHSEALDRRSTRIAFYLYVGVTEKNTETGVFKQRTDMWPFFISRRDFNGNHRLQILAPLESILGNNRGIERNWSPLWSLWRAEDNPKAGTASRSLLWNLYRRETGPNHKKTSLLFGLFQYQRAGEISRTRWFYFPASPGPVSPSQNK